MTQSGHQSVAERLTDKFTNCSRFAVLFLCTVQSCPNSEALVLICFSTFLISQMGSPRNLFDHLPLAP
jgi:hypothetical protein